jgi:hypothetical protein
MPVKPRCFSFLIRLHRLPWPVVKCIIIRTGDAILKSMIQRLSRGQVTSETCHHNFV